MRAWAPRAPRPSYGWWALAANLLEVGLYEAADAVTRRALAERASPPERLRRDVVGKLMSWSIRQGDRPTMRRWLEVASALEAEG